MLTRWYFTTVAERRLWVLQRLGEAKAAGAPIAVLQTLRRVH